MEINELTWGSATPEFYDPVAGEALHVLNVYFIGEPNRNRVLMFACARIRHFCKQLPPGTSQRIRFDLRGQRASNRVLAHARQTIADNAMRLGIPVSVEFITN